MYTIIVLKDNQVIHHNTYEECIISNNKKPLPSYIDKTSIIPEYIRKECDTEYTVFTCKK